MYEQSPAISQRQIQQDKMGKHQHAASHDLLKSINELESNIIHQECCLREHRGRERKKEREREQSSEAESFMKMTGNPCAEWK